MKFLKNKKGVALEMAIVMMILVFAMTSIMLTAALTSKKFNQEKNDLLSFRSELDAVGEAFIASNDKQNFTYEGAYVYQRPEIKGSGYGMKVSKKYNKTTWTLTVEVDGEGNVLRYTNN